MGAETTISWTHHTHNPIVGCARKNSACLNCYAEQYAERWGLAQWGVHGTRHITSDNNWKKPIKWQKDAEKKGIRQRVFCASLSDVMEDHPVWLQVRDRLWDLIERTPNLDWMLLTKRPENYERFIPDKWKAEGSFPKNVWLGATIANQKDHDSFMPHLYGFCKKHNVPVMFISMEPLLGPITFTDEVLEMSNLLCLIGGESGHVSKIRKLDLTHVRHIINQLKEHPGAHIFFKQLGTILAKEFKLKDSKGETLDEYPQHLDWLRVRRMPHYAEEYAGAE